MIGKSIREIIPADRQAEEDRIIALISEGEAIPTFETVRLHRDGSEVELEITVSPIRDGDGNIVAASSIARDISEHKKVKSQLDESETRFHLMADNITQLAWIADSTGWLFWYNKRWFDYTGTTLEEMLGWGWRKVHHPDYIDGVNESWNESLAGGHPWEHTFPLRAADGTYRWFLSRATPMRDEAGKIVYWFGTNTDITEMRDAEQRIELLLMEVNHRSKNMLAVLQSVAKRTAAGGGDYVTRLDQRIRAMAANQDLLVHRAWSSVPIRDLIDAQLRFLGDAQRALVTVEGPELALVPGAAETISMAVHELATNALKYGALSQEGGSVTLAWDLRGEEPDRRFYIEWTERDGPSVTAPQTSGFGTQIMREVPVGKLGAEVDLDYAAEGFAWRLACPADRVLKTLT